VGDLKEMNKVLKVVGLVVLALVVLVALVIVFVPIDGYTMLARIQVARERNKPLSPNYTATSYSFDFYINEEGQLASKIMSERASSLVDIKINGGDQPIKVTVPASYTISWTVDNSLLNNPAEKCIVYGTDETGAFVEKEVSTGSGEWKVTGASFTRDRPAVGPGEAALTGYVIDCRRGKIPDQVIDIDGVEVWFVEATGQ